MKKRYRSLMMAVCMICCLTMNSCSAAEISAASSGAAAENTAPLSETQGGSSFTKINISFNGHTYPATLTDNTSAEAFAELLKSGPLTVSAHDYGGFEKVGNLETVLPRNDEQITTSAGDIILYQGDQITVYYAENSWSFTRLGRIDDPSGLRDALGGGDVTITFALAGEAPGRFDLAAKKVALNSGYEMPINGLGTYSLHGETCVTSVKSALASGVRLIDTASVYGNEQEVGQAIREAMEELGFNTLRKHIKVEPEVFCYACDRLGAVRL